MKVIVTGATGYIGMAVTKALLARGHRVLGMTRSPAGAAKLTAIGAEPLEADLADHRRLAEAIGSSQADALVGIASAGLGGGSAKTFAIDRDAAKVMIDAWGTADRPLIFTSGSAVFGTFADGERSEPLYDEDATLPLSTAVMAPATSRVPTLVVEGFRAAMNARVETEDAVLNAPGIRGIVIRPGLVHGHGGSYDIPALIAMAVRRGYAFHLGSGATSQSYVHVDDLAELYCLAVETAPAATVLHGAVAEISMRELAVAIADVTGLDRVERVTLHEMMGFGPVSATAMAAVEHVPRRWTRALQSRFPQPAELANGLSASMNKRIAATRTRASLGWSPSRTDILHDVRTTYVRGGA